MTATKEELENVKKNIAEKIELYKLEDQIAVQKGELRRIEFRRSPAGKFFRGLTGIFRGGREE